MSFQVTDGAHIQFLRFLAPHHERIGVVKSEWLRHADAKLRQRGAHSFRRS